MYALFTAIVLISIFTSWKVLIAAVIIGILCIIFLPNPSRHPRFPSSIDAHWLATETANLLEKGMVIADRHAYYCGMGLAYIDGVFIYSDVQDGEICGPGQGHHGVPERKEFKDKGDFIAWLESHLVSRPLHETTDICFTRVSGYVEACLKSDRFAVTNRNLHEPVDLCSQPIAHPTSHNHRSEQHGAANGSEPAT